jgi:hypothetical protein
MKIINITMTAICRPEILERTLKSFRENMFIDSPGLKYNLIVNIDPVGDKGVSQDDIENLCKKYFDSVKAFKPSKPGFGQAFKTIWSHSVLTSPAHFTFHLEDDWELLRPVDLDSLCNMFTKYPNLQILRLSAFQNKEYHSKNWNHYLPFNGVFYEVPNFNNGLLGYAGHPSLIRQEFVIAVAPVLDPGKNPEKQIKGNNKAIEHLFKDPNKFGVFSEKKSGPLVKDTGTQWRAKSKYSKKGSKAHFTEYEEIKTK